MIGYCKYCNQGIEIPAAQSQLAADEAASLRCDCLGSRRVQRVGKAAEAVAELAREREWTEGQAEVIARVAKAMLREELEGAVLTVEGVRVAMKIGKTGNLSISAREIRERTVEID